MPVNVEEKPPSEEPKSNKLNKEQRAKMFKQHMEILKLREELQNAATEKQQLEDEIKSRN